MKLQAVLAFIFAAFTACTLAAPANGESLLNDTALDSQDGIFHGALPNLGPDVNKSAIFTPDGDIINVNDTSMAGPLNEAPWLIITMGTSRQHVGPTKSRNLGAELRKILEEQCDTDASVPGAMCRRDTRRIDNIRYNVGTNAHLQVTVESDYIPLPSPTWALNNKILLRLFIDQIVTNFDAAIQCNKNRYQLTLPIPIAHNCVEWGNSADWYQVGIHGRSDFPHMRVKIHFNGKTTEGMFDCKGTQTSVWNTLDDHRLHQYAQVMATNLRTAVSCAPNDNPSGSCSWNPKDIIRCTIDPECVHK